MSDTSRKPSKIARYSAARLAAVQTVYQIRAAGHTARSASNDYLEHYAKMPVEDDELVTPDKELYGKIVNGVETRLDDLQAMLGTYVQENRTNTETRRKKLDILLESLLLCGLYELMAHHELDPPVIISDYLHVTHAFYDQNESAIVNGILDRAAGALR